MSPRDRTPPDAPPVEAPAEAAGAGPPPVVGAEEEALALVEPLVEALEARVREEALEEARRLVRRERARDRALLDAVDPVLPRKSDPRTRCFRQWAVAHEEGLSGTDRALLHAVLLRMKGTGEPATAGYGRLARDASVSRSSAYGIFRRLAREGTVSRRTPPGSRVPHVAVVLDPDRETRLGLFRLWRTRADAHFRAWAERVEARDPSPDGPGRYEWTRALRDADLPTPAKGAGWAVALLARRENGVLRRATSYREAAALSGWSRGTVRTHLRALEAGGWLDASRPPGRGLYARLTFPAAVLDRLALRDELRGTP